MPFPSPDIEAEISFLTTEQGGRSGPCFSGYRPNHDFGIDGITNDAQHDYLDKKAVAPGETVLAHLKFLTPELQFDRLYKDFEFTVREGARIVGRGRITKIFNKALISSEH